MTNKQGDNLAQYEGREFEMVFWPNQREGSLFRLHATHLGAQRAPKVVLSNDRRIRPGQKVVARITKVAKPRSANFGHMEAEFVRALEFSFDGVWLDPKTASRLRVLLDSGLNILLWGPQGSGKTVVTRAVAEQLGYEYHYFNCGAINESADEFMASLQLRTSSAGHPETVFVPTDFARALDSAATHPATDVLVFLDELNRCPESARNGLMPALDSTRRIWNPINQAFMAIPENVQFVAAVNRGQGFSGTYGIDVAQLDRFAPVQMTYMPPAEEKKFLRNRHPELNAAIIDQLVDLATKVRQLEGLATGLSVRATDEACIVMKHPDCAKTRLRDVLRDSFCGRFAGAWDEEGTDAALVWDAVKDA